MNSRVHFKGGSDHVVAGPLFDPEEWEDIPFEDLWYQGSRIGMQSFDKAPRVTEPAQYIIRRNAEQTRVN